jgi:hypothetical protein
MWCGEGSLEANTIMRRESALRDDFSVYLALLGLPYALWHGAKNAPYGCFSFTAWE